ncbi:MAG TPA: hypothetical protein VLG76_05860 [Rhabdochlamydiaceae bacterium]|nr:hypothetical protein [Rhabdochlamydiaceae bacterium]
MNETNQVNITPATMDDVPGVVIQYTASFLDDKSAFVWMQTSQKMRHALSPVLQQRRDKKAAAIWAILKERLAHQGYQYPLQPLIREIERDHPGDSPSQKVTRLYKHVIKKVKSWEGGQAMIDDRSLGQPTPPLYSDALCFVVNLNVLYDKGHNKKLADCWNVIRVIALTVIVFAFIIAGFILGMPILWGIGLGILLLGGGALNGNKSSYKLLR